MPKRSGKHRIIFDGAWRTFSIYPGKSLYAFCITPEGSLEHLYWGKELDEGYDLRYLSQSARLVPHDTVEEILQIKKNSRSMLFEDQTLNDNVMDPRNKIRYDNLKWRTRAMGSKAKLTEGLSELNLRSSMSSDQLKRGESRFDSGNSLNETNSIESAGSIRGRTRAASSPLQMRPVEQHLQAFSQKPMSDVPAEVGAMKRTPSGVFDFASRRAPVDEDGNIIETRVSRSGSVNLSSGTYSQTRKISDPPIYENVDSRGDEEPQEEMHFQIAGAEIDDYSLCGGLGDSSHGGNRSDVSLSSAGGFLDGRYTRSDSKASFVSSEGYLSDDPRVESNTMRHHRRSLFGRKKGLLGKGTLCMEYSDLGTGDFRAPSFQVACPNGSVITPVRYQAHRIVEGKIEIPNFMPGIRGTPEDSTTLIVTMFDEVSGLELDLYYVCLHNYDAIARRTVFRNRQSHSSSGDERPKLIQRAHSVTVDFESSNSPFHLVQLSGSWARERHIVETKLRQGMHTFGSNRGVSSHQQSPFAIITSGPPDENHGEAKAFSLVYSGNFVVEAELSEMGRLRFNMGINPMGFAWHLEPGQSFHSPEVLMVRSDEGLGGISRVQHKIILNHLIPPNWSDTKPPIILNTWEAKYFGVTHDNVVEMALDAVKVNADLLVLDDGWFGVRDDDTSSLGDWTPNPVKFPFGLRKLAWDINQYGVKFGLWIEPEMVSTNSNLYRQHPDWCLHVPGLAKQIGRNQLVLDLSRKEVREYLYESLHNLLSSANIAYIKWDMNRPLTEVFSQRTVEADYAQVWQAETSHRFVLGVYELMSKLRAAFPQVLFEHCASGGGRFDLGMLYFSPQIWTSDNTDAVARMKIQYGSSLCFPVRCIGAHISEIPNHITGNTTRAKTRAMVAMCGTFGYEMDLSSSTPKEILMYRDFSYVYLGVAPIIRYGSLYRLWDPFKVSFASWMYVSEDKKQAVVFCFSLNSDHWSNLVPRLLLKGLDPNIEYEITEPLPNNIAQQAGNFKIIETDLSIYQLGHASVTLSGNHLMSAGLPIKFYTLDDSVMFVIKEFMGDD